MGALASLGAIGTVLFLLVLALLGFLLPLSAYSAQKYAYKTFREIEKLNRNVDALRAAIESSGSVRADPATGRGAAVARLQPSDPGPGI